MRWLGQKTPWEKEWERLKKHEETFLKRQKAEQVSLLNNKLQKVVPPNLREKLDLAFEKAFQLVFEKGTETIEKTYGKEKQKDLYKVHEFALGLRQSKRNFKAFSKQAGSTRLKNLVVSGVEGVGLGLLGIGLPDIPLFTGMILKSVYEIAISYGFTYDTEKERLLILKIIRAALEDGEDLYLLNDEVNEMIAGGMPWKGEQRREIKMTAGILSREMLYMKFLQGVPVAGVAGGIFDALYLKKITDYASIKYQRRFLLMMKD